MKSIILLSGGLDSAVSLSRANRETEVALCLTFDYGQRAAKKEAEAAGCLAAHYRLPHRIIELPFLREITGTALVAEEKDLPEPEEGDLDEFTASSAAAVSVWVPNRNGVFINIAAAFAETLACTMIITGFNREEAATFPDNSAGYIVAANDALHYSTLNQVKVYSYTQDLDKVEIIRLGMALSLPFQHIWSCYRGGNRMCGRCESCRRFLRAAAVAGLGDGAVSFARD